MSEISQIRPGGDDLQPHNVEAEQALLGALLNDNDLYGRISDLIASESFWEPLHGRIFALLTARIEEGHLANVVTLRLALESGDALKEIGGPAYLIRMAGAAAPAAAVREYALMIADLHAKRKLLGMMAEARETISAAQEPASRIAQQIETSAGALASQSATKPLIRSHLSSIVGAIEQISRAYQGEVLPGVSTGLPQLDRMLGYLRPGNVVVIAGRASMGKTTVAQNIAYAAASAGVGVFFGSLEMTGEDLGKRFISKGLAQAGKSVEYSRMILGRLSEQEMRAVVEEGKRQQHLPLFIGERDVRDTKRFRSAIKRTHQTLADTATPLGLAVVDYVQMMQSAGARSAYDNVSAASDACKSLAMELGIPVIALAQLSREVERRDPPIPMLADLRESGKLEEDADAVLFCYRDAYYLKRKLDALDGSKIEEEADLRAALSRCEKNVDLIVAKQRSGPTGTVNAFIEPGLCHVSADRSNDEGMLL